MDDAAPAAGAATDEATAAEKNETKAKRRLFRRVPTSVVVTLLGVALTAWLLPAFTRQWDDRQKATEFKSALVADMAAASARALNGGESVWAGKEVDKNQLGDDWAVASLQIEARLHAYFDRKVVDAWRVYAWSVDRYAGANRLQADSDLRLANKEGWALDVRAADVAAEVLGIGNRQRPGRGGKPHFTAVSVAGEQGLAGLEEYLSTRSPLRFYRTILAPTFIPAVLLRFEEEIGSEVLAAHVRGYSTTTHDLLHDLIPGLG